MTTLTVHPQRNNADFRVVARSFLLEEGLPLANVLPAAEIERIFRRHDAIFGDTYNAVYNTAIVLWASLSQVLALPACQALRCDCVISCPADYTAQGLHKAYYGAGRQP